MPDDDVTFMNMDSWKGGSSGKFGLTFKQILHLHIHKCVQNGSVEWHGGYWNESGSNPITRTYIPNSRETYCNSVRMLRALLLGYFDKDMKDADDKLQEEYKQCLNKKPETKETRIEYFEKKVEWFVKMFEELIMLSKRNNFLEEESFEEEM